MNIQTKADVTTAKTAELVAFYNSHMAKDKRITKFSDRATAEKRVCALLQTIAVEEKDWTAPVNHAVDAAIKDVTKDVASNIKKGLQQAGKAIKEVVRAEVVEKRNPVAPVRINLQTGEVKKTEKTNKDKLESGARTSDGVLHEGAARKSNAEGIAASWSDPTVRAERLTRQGVIVSVGKSAHQYNSTKAAFEALNLPISKHIRFRMKLKAAGKLDFEHEGKVYSFSIL